MSPDDDGLDTEALHHLLTLVQDGVVSRRQLLGFGARACDVRRMLRRRELTTVHPGVYVVHTGPLTWDQRAWAAVLTHHPAALTRESALPTPPERAPIQVAIDERRSVVAVPGVVAHRTAGFADRVVSHSAPPRIALEHAALDVAVSRGDVVDRFRVLADVVQTRRTTAADIAAVARTRRGLRHRGEVLELLADLEQGACSVLERAYLLLERRHGLASAGVATRRQAPGRIHGGRICRDVDIEGQRVVIELDARAFHDTATARDRDATRDLESAVSQDRLTIRLTHAMVVRDGCRTMSAVEALLVRRGWSGRLTRCPGCGPEVDARIGATG